MFYRTNKENNYTMVDNNYIKDKRLSLKTKGLFTVILALPDNWIFSNSGIESLYKESRNAVNNALKELKKYSYLGINRKQYNDGKFYYDYDVFETPGIPVGNTDYPYTDK